MRRAILILAAVVLLLCGLGQASADPLRLDYSVTPAGGGLFDYTFTLTLDNHDNSWAAGQGWGWLIFGDELNKPSPIADFTMTSSFPVGPWTFENVSGGFHNGPSFGYAFNDWVPAAVGDSLTWSGTSATNLGQGELLFSTIASENGAVMANFDVANEVSASSAVPEPSTLTLLGIGAICSLGYGWRRRKQAVA